MCLLQCILKYFVKPNPRIPKHSSTLSISLAKHSLSLPENFNAILMAPFTSFFSILTLFLCYAPLKYSATIIPSTNSTKRHHKWVGPSGHLFITVDARGTGDFLSVQAAVDAVPDNNTKNVLIKINAGFYV